MKRFAIPVFTTLFLLLSAAAAFAQTAPRVGGFTEVDRRDSRVKAAAEFAAKAQTEKTGKKETLMSIAKAERQTVAGTNYRLCLKVTSAGEDDEAEIIHYVKAIVYVDLKGNSKLTAWENSNCGDDDDD